jgi:hypothetical protein
MTYSDGSPCGKQREPNRLIQVDPLSARSPGPAVISQVLRGRNSLRYPDDKPGGSQRLLLSIMSAQFIEKD